MRNVQDATDVLSGDTQLLIMCLWGSGRHGRQRTHTLNDGTVSTAIESFGVGGGREKCSILES